MKQNWEYHMHFFQNRYNRVRKIWKRAGKCWTYGKAGVWNKSYLTLNKKVMGERH